MFKKVPHGCKETVKTGHFTTNQWMTRGRTVLVMKDSEKGTSPGNYRPITCLPVIWKMLTGLTSEEVYLYLDREDLLPEEQKGCRRGSCGTNDELLQGCP